MKKRIETFFSLKDIKPIILLCYASLGWLVGFTLIYIFTAKVKNPDPAWGSNWRLKPLIITPLFAAIGAAQWYVMTLVKNLSKLQKTILLLGSALGCLIAVWLGFVLGLDGTLWH